jgi:hypothetical protein
MIPDVMLRIEPDPHQRDRSRGWAAELADPMWLLGRQWQMGEHQGEDASSPVTVELTTRRTPIAPLTDQPEFDPCTTPAEAILESEPGDWWTPGRRIRIGRAVAAAARDAGRDLPDTARLRPDKLPAPYHELATLSTADTTGGDNFDGRILWQSRTDLGLDEAWFGEPAPPATEPVDLWNPAELTYSATFTADGTRLVVDRHDGGDLDWFSADADGEPLPAGNTETVDALAGRVTFPSAPRPRWWQIEDAATAVGEHAPDRSGIGRLVLIDLIVNHTDDWFTFAVPARSGEILTLEVATVVDSFGQRWDLAPPADWSLFATTGLDPRCLVLWAVTATPLAGPLLDEVVVGIDEDANLVWAVERIVGGRTTPTPEPVVPSPGDGGGYEYRPMTPVPKRWHPYVLDDADGPRRFVQGRAVDLSGPVPVPADPPVSDLLYDPAGGGQHPVHQLNPSAIPQDGLRIERRAMLARAVDGSPVLWTQRRRAPMLTPPTLALRFDTLQPVAAAPT